MLLTGAMSVTALSQHIQQVVEQDDVLFDVWVIGEVSNLRPSSAGHTYFTIKDARSQLTCVLMRQKGVRQARLLRVGMAILLRGRVVFYTARGTCDIYVDLVQPAGAGLHQQSLDTLRDKLINEGLCRAARKRPLPMRPRTIGVVTSPHAAAWQDIIRVVRGRYPLVTLILSPTLVQGDTAAPRIVRALEKLNNRRDVDVIIVARGGGSAEDLWPFNDEALARAIVASPQPVVTGIGHETDVTIADLVADLRAPTPSAAAAAVVPAREDVMGYVSGLLRDTQMAMTRRLRDEQQNLDDVRQQLAHATPVDQVRPLQRRVDDLRDVMAERWQALRGAADARLSVQRTQLDVLGTQPTLDRGFAVLTTAHGDSVITRRASVVAGQRLRLWMADGSLAISVLHHIDEESLTS